MTDNERHYDLMTQAGRDAADREREIQATLDRLPIGAHVAYSSVPGGPTSFDGVLTDIRRDTLIATVETATGREYIDTRLLTRI